MRLAFGSGTVTPPPSAPKSKRQHGLPQQSQQLLDAERLPQHRDMLQSVRQVPPGIFGIGGHASVLISSLAGLCNILSHKLVVLIHKMYELGIDPVFWSKARVN